MICYSDIVIMVLTAINVLETIGEPHELDSFNMEAKTLNRNNLG